MATVRSSLPHEERTAAEPRENRLETVIVSHIQQVNDNIRIFRLKAENPNHSIKFQPGQWVDTWVPGVPKAGGFTITSTPSEARHSGRSPPYLELAVQKSPNNPPAQWLWQPEAKIMGAPLRVRVGGSFVWPPPGLDTSVIDRLVLIAGGVGINPLISIFAHLMQSSHRPKEIHFVYSTKAAERPNPESILFLPRLMDLVDAASDSKVTLSLFLTDMGASAPLDNGRFPTPTFLRRPTKDDLLAALDGYRQQQSGDSSIRFRTLCYVCGPPRMTDSLVLLLSEQPGMARDRVLCEKWW